MAFAGFSAFEDHMDGDLFVGADYAVTLRAGSPGPPMALLIGNPAAGVPLACFGLPD